MGARGRGTLPATSWDTQRFEVTTHSSAGSLSGSTSSVLQKGRQFISRVKWETQKEREGGTWKKEQLSSEGSGRKREKLTLIVGVCHFHNSSLSCYIWFPFVGKKTKAQKHSVDKSHLLRSWQSDLPWEASSVFSPISTFPHPFLLKFPGAKKKKQKQQKTPCRNSHS